jgi:two-component system OmpR family response regulator
LRKEIEGRNDVTVSSTTARILVVDDEDSILDMVSSALRFAGYEVSSEQAGFDALRAVKAAAPDLIVLDVNLPDVDGFEICRRMRRDGLDTPVIFLTARVDPSDLRAGFGHGGDDYLTKPFSLEELGLRIEAVLRRSRGAVTDAHRLTNGELLLDEDAHQVFWREQEIDLSPTEFRLLHYLMLNPGRVLSKLQILDYVWEYDFDGDGRIVETYISYLRKKLGPEGGETIKTVRGVGYVLRTNGEQ